MAIKTTEQGVIPAIILDHIQYSQLNITVSETSPYTIAVSAKVRLYGIVDGVHHYAQDYQTINITNVSSWIAALEPAQQSKAVTALQKINEGLGTLSEIELNIPFVQFEM